MPNQLQKSLQDYISKIKKPTMQFRLPSKKLSSSTSWILRGCKHPKTPSFAFDHHGKEENEAHKTSDAATLSDIDRFLFENFRSLYQKEYDDARRKNDEEKPGAVLLFESPRFLDLPVNFRGSRRFFIDRSSSGSLIEEARTSMTTSEFMASSSNTNSTPNDSKRSINDDDNTKDAAMGGPDDFITLLAYSPNPYDDFKRSMHEMIEARLHYHGKVDWEFMEELLFCYLDLNDKKSYKFILGAFVDLIVLLRENSGRVPAKSRNVRSTGERRKKREI